jgi:large subunit ribosomal protein L18
MHGTAERPRLSIFRSNRYTYLQVIDDDQQQTLLAVNDAGQEAKLKGTKTQRAEKLAADLAKQLKKAKIKALVFDRGSYKYHGRVKAIAETLRAEGIKV